MDKNKINELFYIKKDYSKIKEILKYSKDSWSFNILAKVALYESNINKAYANFEKSKNVTGCAYCEFLDGNIKQAKKLLELIKVSSSFSNWLYFFINLSENEYGVTTYFQVRNFYEQDLAMLINYKQYNISEKIINEIDYIANFNREVYKYCARVLLMNEKIKAAGIMLKKSIDICYTDPETHYLMGELSMIKGEIEMALEQYNISIKVNGGYYPAEEKIKELKKIKKIHIRA